MEINLNDNRITTTAYYDGEFNNATTYVKGGEKTDQSQPLFQIETKGMNDTKLIENLRSLLIGRYNNDVELLSQSTGIPVSHIKEFLAGETPPSTKLLEIIGKQIASEHGDCVYIGGKIEIKNYNNCYFIHDNEALVKLQADMEALKEAWRSRKEED